MVNITDVNKHVEYAYIAINYGTRCCFVALTLPNLPQDIVSLDLVASHYGENYVMQNIPVFNCCVSRNIESSRCEVLAVIKYTLRTGQELPRTAGLLIPKLCARM